MGGVLTLTAADASRKFAELLLLALEDGLGKVAATACRLPIRDYRLRKVAD